MNTFLPYPDMPASAKALDDRRLGKQRIEIKQMLHSLAGGPGMPWRNHPAVLMWEGHEQALAFFGMCCCAEWVSRGFEDYTAPAFEHMRGRACVMPWWWHDERMHSGHRSVLLAKARDGFEAAKIIAAHGGQREVNELKVAQSVLNWYMRQGWKDEPKYAYWWPTHEKEKTHVNV